MKRPSPGIKTAVDSLRAEEQRLESELASLKLTEKNLAGELRRVRAGIQALTGETTPGAEARPSLSDSQALELIVAALRRTKSLPAEALKAKLMEHVREQKLSGTGIHLVLRRVLKDPSFKETPQGFELSGLTKETNS